MKKTAILTFVNQLNYGGVLQAYALQQACKKLGYDVDQMDYWLEPDNAPLTGGRIKDRLIRFIKDLIKGRRPWLTEIRRYRTKRFLRDYIQFSSKTYHTPQELEKQQEYGRIIVGSDQVWNYLWSYYTKYFLLGKMTDSVERFSYAASMGFKDLPDEYLEEYRHTLNKFKMITVREAEGVEQIKQWTGRDAKLVLDPVLLLDQGDWQKLVKPYADKPYLFCYWLGDFSDEFLSKLIAFSEANMVDIHLLSNTRIHPPSSRVKLVQSAGPQEFVSEIANATGVITDSFHAMAFATIFQKPMRIVGESSEGRKGMTARLEGFMSRYGRVHLFSKTVGEFVIDFDIQSPCDDGCLYEDKAISFSLLQGMIN